MIKRTAEAKLKSLAGSFPAVAVIGPRQSGKTTLVKKLFPGEPYVLLGNPDTRQSAVKDPRAFYPHRIAKFSFDGKHYPVPGGEDRHFKFAAAFSP